jgi:hypothetical protein
MNYYKRQFTGIKRTNIFSVLYPAVLGLFFISARKNNPQPLFVKLRILYGF